MLAVNMDDKFRVQCNFMTAGLMIVVRLSNDLSEEDNMRAL